MARALLLPRRTGDPDQPALDLERALAAARLALGDAAFAGARATARTLPVEQAVADALAGSADDFDAAQPAGGG